mmetsp:Transcript_23932/g.80389  ORF Transcript_23932/g.80389 Transcript_23932/m.80389 type:complete len:242 (-) Transcript_23932:57-782(-)
MSVVRRVGQRHCGRRPACGPTQARPCANVKSRCRHEAPRGPAARARSCPRPLKPRKKASGRAWPPSAVPTGRVGPPGSEHAPRGWQGPLLAAVGGRIPLDAVEEVQDAVDVDAVHVLVTQLLGYPAGLREGLRLQERRRQDLGRAVRGPVAPCGCPVLGRPRNLRDGHLPGLLVRDVQPRALGPRGHPRAAVLGPHLEAVGEHTGRARARATVHVVKEANDLAHRLPGDLLAVARVPQGLP